MSPAKNRVTRVGAIAALALAGAASAGTQRFLLQDHPDGVNLPPPYGLRMDGLFNAYAGGGANAATTFSFNNFDDVILTVNSNGSSITINIAGTVYGGVDNGAAYGFGEGSYDLNFDMTMNVSAMGSGWVVSSPSNGVNQGTLTAGAGIAGVAAGTVFNIYESNSMMNPFKFLQDDHRLNLLNGGAANYPEAGQGLWVGRGWNTSFQNGNPSGPTQDWLFTGSRIVPLPTGAGLACAAALCVFAPRTRRRR